MKNKTFTALTVTLAVGIIALFMTTTAFAHGSIDQSNFIPGPAGGSQILAHLPAGQEFTPSRPTLVGVDINLRLALNEGPDTLTVNIRQGDIFSPILATTSKVVAPCPDTSPFACELEHFDFPATLAVTPGSIYVLELLSTKATHAWARHDGNYSGGAAIIQGIREPDFDFSFQTYSELTEVPLDIKPNEYPNNINPRSHGKVKVAVLTTNTFNANTIDATTIRFGKTGSEAAPVRAELKDVDGDGDVDLLLRFRIDATGIICGDTSAILTGKTFSLQTIQGTDSIRTTGCPQYN